MTKLTDLESQLANKRLEYQRLERKRLAAFKAVALLVTKVESERERAIRDEALRT